MLRPLLRAGSVARPTGRREDQALALVPGGSHLVEPVGAELVEHERPAPLERPRDAIEVRLEALAHVVEDAARDDRVEAGVVLQLLELDPPEDRPVGSGRVDRRDLVPGGVEGERELPLAAADFQHPCRARGQMR